MPIKVTYQGEVIDRYYLDFLIEDEIVLELKKGDYFNPRNIKQVVDYLKVTSLKLGIIVVFAPKGIKFKRVINIK